MTKKIETQILDKSKYGKVQEDNGEKMIEIPLTGKERLIVTYSPKRAEKEKRDREKAVKKLKGKIIKSKKKRQIS